MKKNNIIITLTTAIIDDNITKEQRVDEYKECFEIIKNFGYENFHIIETALDHSSFLESYSKNVFYTNVNGVHSNRGTNYVKAFKEFLNNSNFEDDDIIIHITGRYPLFNDSFFNNCSNLELNKVGCFKKDDHNQFYLFLFGMRFKELKNLLNNINVNQMEIDMVNLELIFSNLIPHDSVMLVDELGIIGRQSNEKNPDIYGKLKF